MIRLFAAIPTPLDIGRALVPRQTGLAGARWRPLDSFHITLCFFGDVAEPAAADLDDALGTITAPPLDLRLEGVGAFGEGHNLRAVWAGVSGGEPLARLAARCAAAAVRCGLRRQTRRYQPHVTLAYLSHAAPAGVADWLQDHGALKSDPFTAADMGLYSSRPGAESSRYRLERAYRLQP